MGFLDINELKKLSIKEQIQAKKEIIANNSLETIPFIYLPDVYTTDFYFISYSHHDYKEVYNDIFDLEEAGLSIWYDRGIPAGSDWKEVATKYIAPFSCKGTIFYISESALVSAAIQMEIESALLYKKPFLVILISSHKESLRQLIERLYQEKKIDENRYTYYLKVFKEEIIYLTIDSPIETKKEKIINCLPKQKKLSLGSIAVTNCDKDTKRPNSYSLFIDSVNDFYASKITADDYLDLIEAEVLPRHSYAGFIRNPKEVDYDNPIKKLEDITSIEISIDGSCFANDQSLTYIEYPNYYHRAAPRPPFIGQCAFYNCRNLREFKFIRREDQQRVKNARIGVAAFKKCYSLESFDFERLIFDDESFAWCISLKEADLSRSFGKILCSDPWELSIPDRAFNNCHSLETVYFPTYLIYIADRAFAETNLSKVEFPNVFKTIGNESFAYCENLKVVKFNQELEEIGEGAFFKTPVEELIFPASLKVINNCAFCGCSHVKKIVFREGLERIGITAFAGTAIKMVALPSTLKGLGDRAFINSPNLKVVYFNQDLEHFENMKREFKYAFYKDVTIVLKDKTIIKVNEIKI